MTQFASERLRACIDAGAPRFLERLRLLASIPSVSATGEGIRECAGELVALMQSLGIDTEVLETGGAPLVRGEIGAGSPRVVFYGHYDVQPAGPPEDWRSPPFQPEIRDGAIWGRGVGDNKGQLLTHLCAVEAWVEAYGEPPPLALVFAFDGEEEIGSPSSLPFIAEHPDRFGGDLLYAADGSTLGLSQPAMFLGVRGLLYLELRVRGPDTEWHSGSYGGLLPNAIARLATAVGSLVDAQGTVTVPGFLDAVTPPTETQRRLADALPETFLADPRAFGCDAFNVERPRHTMFFEPQFCICGIAGGYVGEGVKTAVPTGCVAKIDITLVPDQDPGDLVTKIREHLDSSGFADVELDVLAACPPISTALDDPYVQMCQDAMTSVWGTRPAVFPSIGGGGPLAAFVGSHGMPAVMVPYGQADLNEHSVTEHLSLEWFLNGVRTSAELMRRLATR